MIPSTITTELFIQKPCYRTIFFSEYISGNFYVTSYYLRFPYVIFYKIKDPPKIDMFSGNFEYTQRKILFVCGCDEYPTADSICYEIPLFTIENFINISNHCTAKMFFIEPKSGI